MIIPNTNRGNFFECIKERIGALPLSERGFIFFKVLFFKVLSNELLNEAADKKLGAKSEKRVATIQ